MKIVDVGRLVGTDREVQCPRGGFTSYRALLAKDGMGFSMHKTCIPQGVVERWHYKRHLEACYCVHGHGVIRNLATGEHFDIWPDVVYALDDHDDHQFMALTDVVLISVFNPPVSGREVHLEDGSYASGESHRDE